MRAWILRAWSLTWRNPTFAPISQEQNGGAAQRVRSLVYNEHDEGFHLSTEIFQQVFCHVFQWVSSGINCHYFHPFWTLFVKSGHISVSCIVMCKYMIMTCSTVTSSNSNPVCQSHTGLHDRPIENSTHELANLTPIECELVSSHRLTQTLTQLLSTHVFTIDVYYNCHNLTVLSLPVKKPFVTVMKYLARYEWIIDCFYKWLVTGIKCE